MKRSEKIKILQGIKSGRITVDSLLPGKVYIIITRSDTPGVYEMDGKVYSEIEYQSLYEQIIQRNNDSIIWNETKSYAQDKTIELEICK